jgi:hypothetical protein
VTPPTSTRNQRKEKNMADARLIVTHLLAAGAGYTLAPRELLETEVAHSGFFRTDTKRVLAAAVESIRAENKLLVYSYKGSAAVSAERDGLLFLDGKQDLIVPAQVGYYVDLSGLNLEDIKYDADLELVTVRLPRLVMGDVVFEPEGARTINGGLLTFSAAEVEQLNRLNYASARRAFLKQAQGATLVDAAKRNAKQRIESQFEVPLRASGDQRVHVVASFEN